MSVIVILGAYLFGSLPIGLAVVKLITGEDIRQHHSGRTGATNVMRVTGFKAGLATALTDICKSLLAVKLAIWLTPDVPVMAVIAGFMAIVGHNYSVFLITRVTGEDGKTRIKIGGGAGGTATVGAATGLWPWFALILIPIGMGLLFGLGYASVATMSTGVTITIVMAILSAMGIVPPVYILFGVGAFILQLIALRPNIQRLMRGEERLVGWRAKRREKQMAAESASSPSGQQ